MSVRRVVGVWLLLAFLMSANGVFREKVLARATGRAAADVISAALGITIILGTSGVFLRKVAARYESHPARVAVTWLGLTVAFEFAMGRLVDHKTWSELFANYAIWRGRLWPAVLASVVASPYLWLRVVSSRSSIA